MPKSSTSPTSRTLKALRDRDGVITAEVVEKWVPLHSGKGGEGDGKFGSGYGGKGYRKDLFGFIDIIALDGIPGVLAAQACGATGFADHLRKIDGIPEVRDWLAAGNRLELWSWRQEIVEGKKRWRAKSAPLVVHPATGRIVTSYSLQAEEIC